MSSEPRRATPARHLQLIPGAARAAAPAGPALIRALVTNMILGACLLAALLWTALPSGAPGLNAAQRAIHIRNGPPGATVTTASAPPVVRPTP